MTRIEGRQFGLHDILLVRIAPDESIVLPGIDGLKLLSSAPPLLFFSPEGVLRERFWPTAPDSTLGSGVMDAGWVGDTLWFRELQQRGAWFVPPDHRRNREIALADSVMLPGESAATVAFPPTGFSRGATLRELDLSAVPAWAPSGTAPGSAFLLRVAAGGTVERVVGAYRQRTCKGMVWPLCDQGERWRISPDGERVLSAALVSSDGTSATIRFILQTTNGDTVLIGHDVVRAVAVTARMGDSILRRVDSLAQDRHAREPLEPYPGIIPRLPAIVPPVHGVLVGRDHSVWIEVATGLRETEWHAFAPDGSVIGRVVLPARSVLEAADLRNLWTIEQGTDSMPSVVRYRLMLSHGR